MPTEPTKLIAVFEPVEGAQFDLGREFSIGSYPGLERLQITRGDGYSCRVVTEWAVDGEHREGMAAFLARYPGKWSWQHIVSAERRRETTWWRRASLPLLLSSTVALLSSLEALRNHHAWLVAPPHYSVWFQRAPGMDRIDLPADVASEIPFELRNRAGSGDLVVRLADVQLSSSTSGVAAAVIAPAEIARLDPIGKPLAPGEQSKQSLALPSLPAGEYRLTARFEGSSGFLLPSGREVSEVAVKAWKKSEVLVTGTNVEPNGCRIGFELALGKPFERASTMELRLRSDRGAVLKAAAFDQPGVTAGEPLVKVSGMLTGSLLKVTLPPLSGLARYAFWVKVAGPSASEEAWRQIGETIARELTISFP